MLKIIVSLTDMTTAFPPIAYFARKGIEPATEVILLSGGSKLVFIKLIEDGLAVWAIKGYHPDKIDIIEGLAEIVCKLP